MLDREPSRRLLGKLRHERHRDAGVLAAVGDVHESFLRDFRPNHEQLLDPALVENALELRNSPQNRQPGSDLLDVCDESHRLEAELRVRQQAVGCKRRGSPAPENDRWPPPVPVPPDAKLPASERKPAGADVHDREREHSHNLGQ